MIIGKKNQKQEEDFYCLNPPFANLMSSINNPPIRAGRNIPEKMLLEIEESGLYLGLESEYGKGYYVGKKAGDDGNILISGINGSGKSFILAKSVIETWHEPFIALDCKGELSNHYKTLRHKGLVKRDYMVFDPTNDGTHYDPFSTLKEEDKYFVENVREIAYTLIPMPPNSPDSYWINMARDLLSAIIVYGFSIGLDFIETMIIAVNLSVPELLEKIKHSNFVIAKMFVSDITDLKKEHQAAIGTDMKQHIIVFATDSCIQEALSSSKKNTFSWDDITTADEAPNIFLRLNQDRLEQWGSMTRLILTQLIRTLERRPDKQSPQGRNIRPILLLLDEFPLLGKIAAITNALTTLRSKRVTFCLMIQSIAQLDAIYGHDVRKIIVDNCQYKAILNITEPDSQEYFSRLIGSIPVGRQSISRNHDPYVGRITYGQQIQEVRDPLILPHEFATNTDILLHTPYGFFSTLKLPVSVTHKHVIDFEKILNQYKREKND